MTIPRCKSKNIYNDLTFLAHDIGIQMNRNELTKTFMMISIWKAPFFLHGLYNTFSAIRVDVNQY